MVAAAAAKPEPEHPPYVDMISDAIASLADRSGSSLQAIKKFVGEKYKLKPGCGDDARRFRRL